MRFNKNDRKYLMENLKEEDWAIRQIEEVSRIAIITLYDGNSSKILTTKQAIDIMGRNQFLAMLDRAAFHWTSRRRLADGREIGIDASSYFKNFCNV